MRVHPQCRHEHCAACLHVRETASRGPLTPANTAQLYGFSLPFSMPARNFWPPPAAVKNFSRLSQSRFVLQQREANEARGVNDGPRSARSSSSTTRRKRSPAEDEALLHAQRVNERQQHALLQALDAFRGLLCTEACARRGRQRIACVKGAVWLRQQAWRGMCMCLHAPADGAPPTGAGRMRSRSWTPSVTNSVVPLTALADAAPAEAAAAAPVPTVAQPMGVERAAHDRSAAGSTGMITWWTATHARTRTGGREDSEAM